MRHAVLVRALLCLMMPLRAQDKSPQGPSDPKAQKTYREGMDCLHKRMPGAHSFVIFE